VDQFVGELNREDFLKVNPMGTVPTVVEGRQVVLGAYVMFIRYLMSNHP
jgi:glutathione S-transferase